MNNVLIFSITPALQMRTPRLRGADAQSPGRRARLRKGAGKCWQRLEEKHAALPHGAASALNNQGLWALPTPEAWGSRTQSGNGERGTIFSSPLILHQGNRYQRERKRCLKVISKSNGR